VKGNRLPRLGRGPAKPVDKIPVRNKGAEFQGNYFRNFPWQGLGKEQNRGADFRGPEFRPLGNSRHSQIFGFRFQGALRDLNRAVTVGVRFDRHTEPWMRAGLFPGRFDISAEIIKMNYSFGRAYGLFLRFLLVQ
jgi:hypothetical protein